MYFQAEPNQDTGHVNVSLDYSQSKNKSILLQHGVIQWVVLWVNSLYFVFMTYIFLTFGGCWNAE